MPKRSSKSKKSTRIGGAHHKAKVFKVSVLGRAEAGKTSLCMRFVANSTLRTYEHTTSLQLYHREMDVRKLRPKLTGGAELSAKKSSGTSGGRKKKKELVEFCQISDRNLTKCAPHSANIWQNNRVVQMFVKFL